VERDPLPRLLRSLRTLAGPTAAGLGDEVLLERFAASRDEAAFELLLWRHGPAVLGVCRRLLGDPNDAEDAFQATFLLLARKAGTIVRRQAVGAWLYRVAYRVALRARAARARAPLEQADLDHLPAGPEPDTDWRELRAVLDEEVNRLPARERQAFVLCCLEGSTAEEAARQLGCPPGTVSSRLSRARQRLRRRLARRGLAPAGLSGATLAPALPPDLVGRGLAAALVYSSGQSAHAALSARAVAHAEGVLRAMFLRKLTFAALVLLLAGCLAVGGLITREVLAAAPPARVRDETPEKPAKAAPGAAAARISVTVVKPRQGGLGRKTSLTGKVEAFDSADVVAAVSGVLTGLDVDIGAGVKKGQVLAQVEAPLLTLGVKQASVAVAQARGLIHEAQARLATARAQALAANSIIRERQLGVKSATATHTFRESEFKRFRALHKEGNIGEELLQERQRLVAAAKADAAAAEAAVNKARADLEVQQGKVKQAEAALATAKSNLEAAEIEWEKARYSLGLTRIVAPFDGVVTRRNYRNGHFLRAEGGDRLPLLTVQRVDRLRLVAEVAERDVPLVEAGLEAELHLPALPAARLTGLSVSRTGFAVDPRTGTMRVEIDLPNPKRQIRPGMFARVNIVLKKGAADILRLPVRCLVPPRRPARQGTVYVVRDGKAHRTVIRIGTSDGKEMDVLSGLKPTDLVVADPKGLSGDAIAVEVKDGGQ
jgi:RND family efflux transporter MFP subunit